MVSTTFKLILLISVIGVIFIFFFYFTNKYICTIVRSLGHQLIVVVRLMHGCCWFFDCTTATWQRCGLLLALTHDPHRTSSWSEPPHSAHARTCTHGHAPSTSSSATHVRRRRVGLTVWRDGTLRPHSPAPPSP